MVNQSLENPRKRQRSSQQGGGGGLTLSGRGAWVAMAAMLLAGAGLSMAAEVSVVIQPDAFPANRAGQLSVTVNGGEFDEPPNPAAPEGVTIRSYGQSRNLQIVNGQMSQSLTQNFVVSANRPGDYTIPPFEVKVKGKTLMTAPVTFSVTQGGAPTPSPGNQSPSSPGSTGAEYPSLGSMRLDFPPRDRDHLFVGEMAPVRIKAYFPADAQVSLQSRPRPEGEGFTLHHLSEKPEQDFEELNGLTYRTLTWFAGVSMAKAGKYPITVSLDATVMVREKSSRQPSRPSSPFGGRGIFDDPFFDDFFDNAFARTIPREVTLTSPGDPLEIRSLPREGRTEDFSGAVGQFSLGAFQLPADATAGEPGKIRVTVNGKGNFERMNAPVLAPADAWKTYAAKTGFLSQDVASFSGSKTFEFSAVPQKAGEQQVRLVFSYFDPETASYQSVSSPEIALKVAGEDVKAMAQAVTGAPDSPPENAGDGDTEEATPEPQLAPPRMGAAIGSGTLKPLLFDPAYRFSIGLAMAGIAGGFVIGAIRKRRGDPARVAAREAQRNETEALADAAGAAQRGDAVAFFAAARRALQIRLGSLWNRPPEAITLAELRRRLPTDAPVASFFRQADAIAYAQAERLEEGELERWDRTLQEALASVTESPSGPANQATEP